MSGSEVSGPLSGIRIIEFVAIGPGPFAAMMLADHGAEVVRIERPGFRDAPGLLGNVVDPTLRGRACIELDLKSAADVATALELLSSADGLIEGFRPGTLEKLGLSPEVVHSRNSALVYGRVTGWGQDGPLARTAGHDINYIALSGALDAIGTMDSGPVPALNLLGDYGGGGMLLAFGMVSALLKAKTSGKGSVVDTAMVDGAALLMALPYGLKASGQWDGGRGGNILDGGAPFYDTYVCADGKWLAVGPLEPQFFDTFINGLGLQTALTKVRYNASHWPQLKALICECIAAQSSSHWETVFAGSDACVTPVLSMTEAPQNAHNKYRETFSEIDGCVQPSPAPIFDGKRAQVRQSVLEPVDPNEILKRWRKD